MRFARRAQPQDPLLEQTRMDVEQMRALLDRYMPPAVVTADGERIVPCPYCAVLGGHVASCRLAKMQTGRTLQIIARPN